MKRNTLIFTAFLLFFIGIGFISCTKKQAPATLYTRIQGKWKLVAIAIDNNGNGLIDEGEKINVPATEDQEITFNSDFTGLFTNVNNDSVSSPALSFNWQIENSDSIICAYRGYDTITYYMVNVSDGSLTLQEDISPTSPELSWYYYNKN